MSRKLIHMALDNYMALNPAETVIENILTLLSFVPHDSRNNVLAHLLGIAETTCLNADEVVLLEGVSVEKPTITGKIEPDFFNGTVSVPVSFLYTETRWYKTAEDAEKEEHGCRYKVNESTIPKKYQCPKTTTFQFKLEEWNTGEVTVNL